LYPRFFLQAGQRQDCGQDQRAPHGSATTVDLHQAQAFSDRAVSASIIFFGNAAFHLSLGRKVLCLG
jgi:hypothetical protein